MTDNTHQVADPQWDTRPPVRPVDKHPTDLSKRDMGIAYILLFFFGLFGIHRVYLGRTGSGFTMTGLTLIGVGIPVTFVWVLVDIFLIPRIYREGQPKPEVL